MFTHRFSIVFANKLGFFVLDDDHFIGHIFLKTLIIKLSMFIDFVVFNHFLGFLVYCAFNQGV